MLLESCPLKSQLVENISIRIMLLQAMLFKRKPFLIGRNSNIIRIALCRRTRTIQRFITTNGRKGGGRLGGSVQ
jgi:hypothetical protein